MSCEHCAGCKPDHIFIVDLFFPDKPYVSMRANFCPSCGRDLRLPAARVYDGLVNELPPVDPSNNHEAWWTLCMDPFDDLNGWRLDAAKTLREMDGTWRLSARSYRFFGPVTVSPAKPEEVPE